MSAPAPHRSNRKRAHSPAPAAAQPPASSSQTRKRQKKQQQGLVDYDEHGPVYDSCNEVRRKIRAYLRKSGSTITAFLRELGGINSNSYRQFMCMKDPLQGSGNCIYPAAYHYFEKRRLAEGKPKSKLRVESEAAFPRGHRLEPHIGRYIVLPGSVPVVDRLGRVTIVPHYPKPRPLSRKQLDDI